MLVNRRTDVVTGTSRGTVTFRFVSIEHWSIETGWVLSLAARAVAIKQAKIRAYGTKFSRTFQTHEAAKRWLRAKERELDSGVDPSGLKGLRREEFADLIEQWIRDVLPSRKSKSYEEREIRWLLAHRVADKSLAYTSTIRRASASWEKAWTPGKALQKFVLAHFDIAAREQAQIVEAISDAVSAVAPQVRQAMRDHPEFADIGKRMLPAWHEGVSGLRDRRMYALGEWQSGEVVTGFSDPPTLENPKTVVGRSELLGRKS